MGVDTRLIGAIILATLWTSGVSAEMVDEAAPEPVENQAYARLASGYRIISTSGITAMASPYLPHRSGVTAEAAAGFIGPDLKLRVDGQFLQKNDYQSGLFLDYDGLVRLELEGRSLYHNLAQRQIGSSFQSTANAALGLPTVDYLVIPSSDTPELGVTSRQNRAETRVRLGNFPAHLSLGFWRFSQTGYEQLVVSDFERTNTTNTFYDVTRRISQAVNEGRGSLDANLGPVSLAYGFKIRDFSADSSAMSVPFAVAVPADSRTISHNAKIYTNLSGGLTAVAAYTLTQRENTTQRSDLTRGSQPRDTIQQVSGDVAYTPFKELTLALKYRRLTIERDTPTLVSSLYSTALSQVRPATSTAKDTLILAATWRPERRLTLRGEYKAELLVRDNVWVPMTATTTQALVNDSSQLHSGTLALLWRPATATKLNASYSYTTNRTPSTQNDFSDRHSGNLLFDWSHSGRWGITTHYRALAEKNDVRSLSTSVPITTLATPRDSLVQSAGSAIWFSPLPRLVMTASYGCMALNARQTLLLSPQTANSLITTNYTSLGHVYGLDGVYAVNDQLDLSIGLQQVRSTASFQVPAQSFTLAGVYAATTAGIGSYGHLNTTESSASARIDGRFNTHLGWALDYRFSAYRSDDRQYDGDLHSATVSLTARW